MKKSIALIALLTLLPNLVTAKKTIRSPTHGKTTASEFIQLRQAAAKPIVKPSIGEVGSRRYLLANASLLQPFSYLQNLVIYQ